MRNCYRFTIGWPGMLFLAAWAGGNVALFWFTFASYMWDVEYAYVFSLVGFSLSFSRGSANALNFNCALILLPVCRNIISLLRRCFGLSHQQCVGPKILCRQLDLNIFFHKIIAYSICFWTTIHFIGHCFNLEHFIDSASSKRGRLPKYLSDLPEYNYSSWVNPIKKNQTNSVKELFTLIPGWSGFCAIVILILMVSASTETVRRKFHEVFWYVHHLFVLFFAFIIVHGFGGVIRGQTNCNEHNPKKCQNMTHSWKKVKECPEPVFAPTPADTWMWVTGPLVLYGIEVFIKIVNRFRKVEIVEAVIHPSDVLELRMTKSGFRSNAGQYITIMCPSLSRLQWHPFTLTSAPEDEYFSVHIRIVGDWTKGLLALVKETQTKMLSDPNNPVSYHRVAVDGPYGTCCEDVFRYKTVMLVGAGIGVTPFASILKHIWHLYRDENYQYSLKKVYFYWICRDKAFMWFNKMLRQLEEKIQETKSERFMSIQIYWTRGWNEEMHKQLIYTVTESTDTVTKLQSKTQFGRPDWNSIFKGVSASHSDEEIGVFYCGPKELTKDLRSNCMKHSNLLPHGRPRFVFHKENF